MSLLPFLVILALSSTAIGLFLLIYAMLVTRARHWPLFWGVGLIASVATAFLAIALSQLDFLIPQLHITPLPVYHGFSPTTWPAHVEADLQHAPTTAWPQILSKALGFLYLTGVFVSLLRLRVGRYRAANIAKASTKVILSDGTVIGLTDEALPCMTVTPLGRPARSSILLSQQFYNVLTPEELSRVVQHEKGHITRRDDEFGTLLRILVALTWFNPITHILFDRWTMSAELQCDQIATNGQSYQMRRAYAHTLLKALHITADRVRQYPAASLSTQNARNEKMRIQRIMNGPAPIFKHIGHKLGLMTTAISVALISAVVLSSTSQADPAPTAESESPLNTASNQQMNSFTIKGELTAAYGEAGDPFQKGAVRNHHGVDFKAPIGTPLYAPSNGIIIEATDVFNDSPAYGKVVILQTEGGVQTMMAHLNGYDVQTGQQVLKGQKIAEIGNSGKSTGPHVHIETRLNGVRVDPMTVWHIEK